MHISYAHAVRGIFSDDFVGQPRLREVFRLQSEMTAEEEYATSLLAITELMKNGTVTFVDPGSTKFLDACMQAYADSRCRIVTGEFVVDLRGAARAAMVPHRGGAGADGARSGPTTTSWRTVCGCGRCRSATTVPHVSCWSV